MQADSDAAVALSLLLLLKRYLKMAYALSDERCRAFSPTEPAKSGDAAAKRDAVGDFDASPLPLAPVGSSRDLWHRYQVNAGAIPDVPPVSLCFGRGRCSDNCSNVWILRS